MLENTSNDTVLTQASQLIFSGHVSQGAWALFILVMGYVIAQVVSKTTARILKDLAINDIYQKKTKQYFQVDEAIAQLLKYAIYVGFVLWALTVINATWFVLNALSIMTLVIVLLVTGFATKDVLANGLAGISLLRKNSFTIHDTITIDQTTGKVLKKGLFYTTIKTPASDIMQIPNALFSKFSVQIKKVR
jgi:small-conductance mechanosensitive channel